VPGRVGRGRGAYCDVEVALADPRGQFMARPRLQAEGALAHGLGQPRGQGRRHLVLEILDDAERQGRQLSQVERVEVPVPRPETVERSP
jgi:hypothetical protein